MKEMIEKYKKDKKKSRLVVLLESHNKTATPQNIDALDMLILDDDIKSLEQFLGIKPADKPFVVETFPHNQDDFLIECKKHYGDIKDPKSLGNRILDGVIHRWGVRSYMKPDAMLKKWASVAGREMIEIDFFANHKDPSCPTWDCCILGTHEINRINHTKVASAQ